MVFGCMFSAKSQEGEKKFGISFGGFVKTDVFFDSRQTVNAREGHFSFYPAGIKYDPDSNDINAAPSLHMLSIQTRLTGTITGPDAFGAKTSGLIEGEFFGTADSDVNGFRLRHAFVKFSWEKSELLAGQFWHPMFIAQAFPEVISFNTGVPFQPFARNPQLRFTKKFGALSAIATAYTQRDFTSSGPAGASNVYIRNASMPAANLTFTFVPKDSKNIFGAGVDYKTIVPEIQTTLGYKTNTSLSSLSATAFAKLVFGKVTWKVQGVYAQNAMDIFGIGGYAVKVNTFDTVTGTREYTNLNTGSAWTEIYFTGEKFVTGLFAGYTQNLGATDEIQSGATNVFARGNNILSVYRVAPRIAFVQGKSTIAFELEYTTAAYGTPNEMGIVEDTTPVSNIRGLLAFIYKF